jgi:hypothetical protein
MFGWGRFSHKMIGEHEAEGEVERVFHEIKHVLRVTGVPAPFRLWAAFGRSFPLIWDALRPNLETRPFEDAADKLRGMTVRIAAHLGPATGVRARVWLGQSQAYQLEAALELYHYLDPKLLRSSCSSPPRCAAAWKARGWPGTAKHRPS